jgi:hypothetical protein
MGQLQGDDNMATPAASIRLISKMASVQLPMAVVGSSEEASVNRT